MPQILNISSPSYERRFYAEMIDGQRYHLPIAQASKIRIPSSSGEASPNLRFTYALKEISREGTLAQVERIEDGTELERITDKAIESAAMRRFLSGLRVR